MKQKRETVFNMICYLFVLVSISAFAGVGYYLTAPYSNRFFLVISYGFSAITMALLLYLFLRSQSKEAQNKNGNTRRTHN